MKINEDHPLRRHFAAIVEQAFCEKVGMCDPSLTTYLVDLLLAFTHIDYLNTMKNIRNRNLDRIASMLVAMSDEKPDSSAERDQATYRQIGDFTLFWAGVYPEQLRGYACKPADLLGDYVRQGKRSYSIVSDLASESDAPPSSLFRHLSDDFEFCLYGLGLVRQSWEGRPPMDGASGGDLIY